jgi:hypothetical protein
MKVGQAHRVKRLTGSPFGLLDLRRQRFRATDA